MFKVNEEELFTAYIYKVTTNNKIHLCLHTFLYGIQYECSWWRLFRKRVARTKFDICVVIATFSNVMEVLNIIFLIFSKEKWKVCL